MLLNKYIYVVIFWLGCTFASYGQCTEPFITAPSEGCIDERITFVAGTNGTVTWDFCTGELGVQPEPERVVENFRSFARSRAIDVSPGRDGGYFLFSVNNAANELIILAFEDLIEDIPVIVQRIDISSFSPQAYDIEVVRHNDIFSVFIACSETNSITRLDFTESLFDTPEITPLNIPFNQQVNAVTIIQEQGSFYGFVSQNDQLSRLSFGSDLQNPSPLVDHFELAGFGTIRKSAFQKYCNSWIGLMVSYESKEPIVVRFDDGSPAGDLIAETLPNNGDDLRAPTNISFQWEGDTFFIHIMGAFGNFYSSQIKATENITQLEITDNGTLGLSSLNYPLKVVKEGPYWVAFSADHTARDLVRYRFPSSCDADQEIAFGTEAQKSFSSSGTKTVSVESFDSGTVQKTSASIQIRNGQSPPAGFSYSSSCVSSPVSFEFTEDYSDISSIIWDFGDGSTGSGTSIEHMYNMPGSYLAKVEIVSFEGCTNRFQQEVKVYEDFSAGFSSGIDLYCTNTEITFTNLIGEDLADVVSNQWFVNDNEVSENLHLNYSFHEPGTYLVRLITQLGNCVSTIEEEIEVIEAPLPSFTVSDACAETGIEFNNTTTGNVGSYLWDFGDGTMSTVKDPLYTYSAPGDYIVRLTVTNDAGCQTFTERLVTVHDIPEPAFSTQLACSDIPVQFIDESFVNNANIESWLWDFGNGNTSALQNPSAVFSSAGNKLVSLTVVSTFGCESTITQNVEVLPSPEAMFTFSDVCPGEPVMFSDESIPPEGEAITEWAWNIGGAFSSQRNPSYTFEFSSEYNVSLTVSASNQCIGMYEQSITLPEAPEIDFDVESNCAGTMVLFTDLTETTEDAIERRIWDFGGLGIGEGEQAAFQFPGTGTYIVSLTLETENGCSYTRSRPISIQDAPVAAFEAEPAAGSPPLEVHFTNTSQRAIAYEWYVDGDLVDTGKDLTYTFTSVGLYDVRLVAVSPEGCHDENTLQVPVLEPQMDMTALSVLPIRTDGFMMFRLTASNNGNIPIHELPVELVLDGNISLYDFVKADIGPGETSTILLPFRLADMNFRYVCLQIGEELNDLPDQNPSDNSACFVFDGGEVVSKPYPNPASSILSFRIYAEDKSQFDIHVTNSTGQLVNVSPILTSEPGVFEVSLDVSRLPSGMYFLTVDTGESLTTNRFVINR